MMGEKMSTSLDYRRKAYTYDDRGETSYVVLHEAGSSNCFESRTGRRARDWYVLADGWKYEVYGKITRYASSAIGGMLKLNNMGGGWTSDFRDALKIMRAYDRALKEALPIAQASSDDMKIIEAHRAKKLQEVA